MNPHQFDQLDDHKKTETVLTACFLADRLTKDHYVRLYNLNNFYIEVFFDDATHLIDGFRAFEHTSFVLPYIEELKIAV